MVAPVVAQAIDVGSLVVWFRRFAAAIEVHADDLSSLDAAIGDADHGTNMRRGCQAVVAALDADRPVDVTGFGKTVGMRLISAVGGASGPLYGSFFLAF
ncbi:MAG TPA: DAK2 domain-containing protein, partial [Euzebya sp.]|nr:DAK2 domain-containing protein [Euzebya sp.]